MPASGAADDALVVGLRVWTREPSDHPFGEVFGAGEGRDERQSGRLRSQSPGHIFMCGRIGLVRGFPLTCLGKFLTLCARNQSRTRATQKRSACENLFDNCPQFLSASGIAFLTISLDETVFS